jgi:phage FluMu protein Com
MENKQMPCPVCNKRACDFYVKDATENMDFFVELKCPNCKKIVKIQSSNHASAALQPDSTHA